MLGLQVVKQQKLSPIHNKQVRITIKMCKEKQSYEFQNINMQNLMFS